MPKSPHVMLVAGSMVGQSVMIWRWGPAKEVTNRQRILTLRAWGSGVSPIYGGPRSRDGVEYRGTAVRGPCLPRPRRNDEARHEDVRDVEGCT